MASFSETAFGTGFALKSAPTHRKIEAQALFEYGITDRLTAVVMPSLQDITMMGPATARRTGLGYTEFGGRFRVYEADGWVAAAQATARIPGTNSVSNPVAIGYTDPEFDIRALFGTSFQLRGLPVFANVEAARRIRTGAPPNEVRVDVTFGVYPNPRLLALLQSFTVVSEGVGAPPFAFYAYTKLQTSLVYAVTPALSLQAGFVTTYAGWNALLENALVLGAWYRF